MEISDNLRLVEENIAAACKRAGRRREEVKLIAVSKTHPVEAIKEAVRYGIRSFGENKVQELKEKMETLGDELDWHLIGHLQTNKVKYVVGKVSLIHSLESIRLAEALEKEAVKRGVIVDVLVEVNIAGEDTKFGVLPENVEDFIREVAKFEHIRVKGLMTVAPIAEESEENRKYFKVPVEALSNGVDLSQFKPAKASSEILKKYQLDDGKNKIMYIGRVDPEKSIDVVVKAFALLLADGILNTELVIVGDGIDVARLKELTEELGISEEVKFLGKIMMPELAKVYRMGTIFATGSETETQGIVLIEAAATGLPLVAVNAGAVGEICVNGFNGELVEAGNIEAFKEAMKKILLDKKLREKYSKNSLEISKKHDLKHTLKRFEEIYEEAIRLKRAEMEAEVE